MSEHQTVEEIEAETERIKADIGRVRVKNAVVRDKITGLQEEIAALEEETEKTRQESARLHAQIVRRVAWSYFPFSWVLLIIPRWLEWYRPVCWVSMKHLWVEQDLQAASDYKCSMCGARK